MLRSLEILDVSNNPPIADTEKLIWALSKLPALKHFSGVLTGSDQEDDVLVRLPNLLSLNGVCVGDAAAPPPPPPPPSRPHAELVRFFAMLEETRPCGAEAPEAEAAATVGAEEALAHTVEEQLGLDTSEPAQAPESPAWDGTGAPLSDGQPLDSDGLSSAAARVNHEALLEQFDRLARKLLDMSSRFHVLSEASGAGRAQLREEFAEAQLRARAELSVRLREVQTRQAARVELSAASTKHILDVHGALVDLVAGRHPTLAQHLGALGDFLHSETATLVRVVRGNQVAYEEEIAELREITRKGQRETTALLSAAEMLEKESRAYHNEKREFEEKARRERKAHIEQLGWLRAENERLRAKLAQAEHGVARPLVARKAAPESALPTTPRSLRVPTARVTVDRSTPTPRRAQRASVRSSARAPEKTLSLRALTEVIREICESKRKYDRKCAEAALPRETLEQHMYTFLNHKYGLRAMVLEWTQLIERGVAQFQASSCEVAVFGKMLRLEVDEEFARRQVELAARVSDALLRRIRSGRAGSTSQPMLARILARRTRGLLDESEWAGIVDDMFDGDAALTVAERIQAAIAHEIREEKAAGSIGGARRQNAELIRAYLRGSHLGRDQIEVVEKEFRLRERRVRFTSLEEIILMFALEKHETRLKEFLETFRLLDVEKTGILSEDQFKSLTARIFAPKPTSDAILQFFRWVDPHNLGRVTFSDCVAAYFRCAESNGANLIAPRRK